METDLKKLCRLFGVVRFGDGPLAVTYRWDYAQDKAVPEAVMPPGSERRRVSDAAKAAFLAAPRQEGEG